MLSRCFHFARLELKYWNSVSTFGALLHFQYHSCEEIIYFSINFSTTFIQYIPRNELTSGQQVLFRCFHCARLESKYWNSVSTFGALLHFQYHSCEEIVYFSRDYSTISSQLWYWKWRSAPKVDTEFQYIDSSLAQWKHRYNTCWPDVTSF